MSFYDQEILRSITNNLSEDKEGYKKFFDAAMKKFGVKSPLELPDEKKKEFYNYIDNNYEAKNEGVSENTEYKDAALDVLDYLERAHTAVKKKMDPKVIDLALLSANRYWGGKITKDLGLYNEIDRASGNTPNIGKVIGKIIKKAEKGIKKIKESINEAKIPVIMIDKDPDKTERSFNEFFKYMSRGHPVIDYGPRESDIYDWNDRRNYEDAIKEYNKYMKGIATKINSATQGMDGIWKEWAKIRDKYRSKDDKLDEGLLNEIPASVFAAAAAVTMKNPKTGKNTKVSTAAKNKDHPLYQKAMSWIKSHTKDKKKDEPKKAAPKKQSKSDADFWKKQYGVSESAPEGWEGTVKAMKGEPGIDNPYALAHWMKNKGYKTHKTECIEILTKLKEKSQNKNLKETVKEVAMPLGSYLEHALSDVEHLIDVVKGEHAEDAYQNAKKSSKLLIAAFKLLKKVK